MSVAVYTTGAPDTTENGDMLFYASGNLFEIFKQAGLSHLGSNKRLDIALRVFRDEATFLTNLNTRSDNETWMLNALNNLVALCERGVERGDNLLAWE